MQIDWNSALSWLSAAIAGGWFSSWLALRKDERAVQVEQITKERAKWRDSMRELTADVAIAWESRHTAPTPAGVSALRAKLAASINPKNDKHDEQILQHFDDLFSGKSSDLNLFTRRIALLLKHDWERVKWECEPLYLKPFFRFTKKQRAWRNSNYRDASLENTRRSQV